VALRAISLNRDSLATPSMRSVRSINTMAPLCRRRGQVDIRMIGTIIFRIVAVVGLLAACTVACALTSRWVVQPRTGRRKRMEMLAHLAERSKRPWRDRW